MFRNRRFVDKGRREQETQLGFLAILPYLLNQKQSFSHFGLIIREVVHDICMTFALHREYAQAYMREDRIRERPGQT